MDPRFEQIKSGWAAIGEGWAVFGATREEALQSFRDAERLHEALVRRPEPKPIAQAS